MKTDNAAFRCRFDHAKVRCVLFLDRDRRDGDTGAPLHMKFDHLPDVHAINVIRAEDHNHVRIGLLDQVDVLVNRIRRPAVPVLLSRSHLCRNGNDEVVFQQTTHLPAFAQMLQKRLALELDQHVDGVNAGVDQIA